MANSLSQYWGGPSSIKRKPTGNLRLSQYYGDQGQDYTNARQIADTFAANIDEYPTFFRRSFIADKLRIIHGRELALLSDALSVLKTRGLILFDPDSNQWKNLSRSS